MKSIAFSITVLCIMITLFLTPAPGVLAAPAAGPEAPTQFSPGDGASFAPLALRNLTVSLYSTSTTLETSLNPAWAEQAVTFTVTVTSIDGTPSGTVAVKDGDTAISGCEAVALSSGQATCTTSGLAAGRHSLTAEYLGDGTYDASSSAALSQVIKPLPTVWHGPTITFSKANYADWTQPENQDHITPNVWITRANTFGIYNIKTETGFVETSPADTEWAYGKAADYQTLTFMPWGSWLDWWPAYNLVGKDAVLHLISEDIYLDIKFTAWTSNAGGGGFTYERSSVFASTTELSSSVNPSRIGQAVTFTAGVISENGAPEGTVAFKDGNTLISGCEEVDLSGGLATCTTDGLAVGTHTVSAWYNGSDTFGPSDASLSQVIKVLPTLWTGPKVTFTKANYADWTLPENQDQITPNVWITRANSQGIFNIKSETTFHYSSPEDTEWAFGKAVDYQTLTFGTWGEWMGWYPLDNMLNRDAVVHLISEDIYLDIKFTAWTPLAKGGGFTYERSSAYATTTTLESSANPVEFGQPLTFTAYVDSNDGMPEAGTVTFKDGDTVIAGCEAQPLTDGLTTCDASGMEAGAHSITAWYSGGGAFGGSDTSAAPLDQTIIAVYWVNSTADHDDGACADLANGDCTLHEAIAAANASPNASAQILDRIYFKIPASDTGCSADTGICTITPAAALPEISDPVMIDGFSQTRVVPQVQSSSIGLIQPKIELSGASAPQDTAGLTIQASASFVRGLSIDGFKGPGIAVIGSDSVGNMLQANTIFGNSGAGIDLNNDGVTHNDAGDGDSGPNRLQNFPVLTMLNGNEISGTLEGEANTVYQIEFYASATCASSGYGQGEQRLAVGYVATDDQGQGAFIKPIFSVNGKPYLTATATNTNTGDTSEFSACLAYSTTPTLKVSPDKESTFPEAVTLTATVTTGIPENPYATGMVQFKDGDKDLGAPVALVDGSAELTTSSLSIGEHKLSVVFMGDATYTTSATAETKYQVWGTLFLPVVAKP